jgi:hypothetical protein
MHDAYTYVHAHTHTHTRARAERRYHNLLDRNPERDALAAHARLEEVEQRAIEIGVAKHYARGSRSNIHAYRIQRTQTRNTHDSPAASPLVASARLSAAMSLPRCSRWNASASTIACF